MIATNSSTLNPDHYDSPSVYFLQCVSCAVKEIVDRLQTENCTPRQSYGLHDENMFRLNFNDSINFNVISKFC